MCAFLLVMVNNSIIKSLRRQQTEEFEMAITKNNGINVNRKFGIEIEFGTTSTRAQVIERLRSAGIQVEFESWSQHHDREYNTSAWKLTTDGSLRFNEASGLELVSPPMTIAGGAFEQIQKVCQVLNSPEIDARINRTCGFHVHHDVADYDHKSMKSLINIMVRYSDAFDELVAPSRRAGGSNAKWCRPMTPENCDREDFLKQVAKCKTIEEQLRLIGTRYVRLNLHSYICYGTVEFRQHQGTTDAEKIINWIVLTQMAVERAVTSPVSGKVGADDWFNLKKIIRGYAWMGADEAQANAIDFFNKRRMQFMKSEANASTSTVYEILMEG